MAILSSTEADVGGGSMKVCQSMNRIVSTCSVFVQPNTPCLRLIDVWVCGAHTRTAVTSVPHEDEVSVAVREKTDIHRTLHIDKSRVNYTERSYLTALLIEKTEQNFDHQCLLWLLTLSLLLLPWSSCGLLVCCTSNVLLGLCSDDSKPTSSSPWPILESGYKSRLLMTKEGK
ncbi:hypothetical protein Pmani_035605 [Petrolisthes manimaculis]|uniref:Uncharacterized protein n=1 Tax=Petrolisthes manimaculis TaxID=1843537 RepID=A0AAE1TN13_9EUCA|nr:hypothetical protein Pmani_035605 [Petrolisthes manimaculis]